MVQEIFTRGNMFRSYFSPLEIAILEILKHQDISLDQLSVRIGFPEHEIEGALEDLGLMGWVCKSKEKYGLNYSVSFVEQFSQGQDVYEFLQPHIRIIKSYINAKLALIPKVSSISLISIVGSYGTNDFVRGVSDIDLGLVYEDGISSSDLKTTLNCLSGDMSGTNVEVWDIPKSKFEVLAVSGFVFPLMILKASVRLFGTYSPPKLGELQRSNLVSDFKQILLSAMVKKLIEARNSVEILNTFVNLSKRASILFDAYINRQFTLDGAIAAKSLGLLQKYMPIFRVKQNLRQETNLDLSKFSAVLTPFHRSLYMTFMNEDERAQLCAYLESQEAIYSSGEYSNSVKELLLRGSSLFTSFLKP